MSSLATLLLALFTALPVGQAVDQELPVDHGETTAIVLEGRVLAEDGSPALGAVVVSSSGGQTVTGSSGTFRLEVALPLEVQSVQITAVANGSPSSQVATRQVSGLTLVGTKQIDTLQLQPSGGCQPSWLPTFGSVAGTSDYVRAFAVFDDEKGGGPALYAGGGFTVAGGVAANRIAKWDGVSWSPVGSGMNDTVVAMRVFDDGGGPALYAAGAFTVAGGVPAQVAKWDGSNWSALGSSSFDIIWALTVYDDGSGPTLYSGGGFIGGGSGTVRKWDGANWSALGSGFDGRVYSLAVFDDGRGGGPALYAGGGYWNAGGVPARSIAKWDGTSWSAFGNGMTGASVFALTVFDDGSGGGSALYAGGSFDVMGVPKVRNIAKWDGANWSSLEYGMNDTVSSLVIFDDGAGGGPALYAAGSFSKPILGAGKHIAKWDGASWSPLASGISGSTPFSSSVHALTVFDDGSGAGPALYPGGSFTIAGSFETNRIAKWDGAIWSALGSGVSDIVRALAVFDDGNGGGPALFAGGRFSSAGGVAANRIVKWDGANWSALGNGMNDEVLALAVFDDGNTTGPALYAGGRFTSASGVAANHIAKWDGASWSPLASGVNNEVRALVVSDPGIGGGREALYVGGNFTNAGGIASNFIAQWDGRTWSALGSGIASVYSSDPGVNALAVFDDKGDGRPALYAGGAFETAGGVPADNIAKWDGANWFPLGSGVNDDIHALAVFADGANDRPALYAGGSFFVAGGVAVPYIAKWDGSSWSTLGTGLFPYVYSLTAFDDGGGDGPALYVGGRFTLAGGITVNHIAKWDGENWFPLGNGMSGSAPPYLEVLALAVFDDGTGGGPALYAGGSFTISPSADSYLAKWGCASPPP